MSFAAFLSCLVGDIGDAWLNFHSEPVELYEEAAVLLQPSSLKSITLLFS